MSVLIMTTVPKASFDNFTAVAYLHCRNAALDTRMTHAISRTNPSWAWPGSGWLCSPWADAALASGNTWDSGGARGRWAKGLKRKEPAALDQQTFKIRLHVGTGGTPKLGVRCDLVGSDLVQVVLVVLKCA